MSTLAISSARYLWRRPWQMMLAVIGIALGVAVVVAVDLANDSALRAFRLSMDQVAGEATHQIIGGPEGVDEQVYTRLRRNGVRDSAPVLEAYGSVDGETVRLLGVDPLAEGTFRAHLSGKEDDTVGELIARPGTAILAAPTARRLGLDPGETFEWVTGGQGHRLRLLDVIEADGRAAATVDGLMLTDIATAQELAGMIGRLSWIDLALPAGTAAAARKENIRDLLPGGAALVPAESRTRALVQMTRAFRTNLTAMSLLALIVGMFLIYNTMTFTVVQRRALLAELRLLGVTRGEILRLVLSEALVLGGVATVIGLGAGTALGRGLLELVTQTINDHYFVLTVTDLRIAPAPLITAGLLGVGATLLAAAGPALEASTTPPHSALHRTTLETRAHALMPRLALAGIAGIAAALAVLLMPNRSVAAGFAGLFLAVLGMTFATPWAAVHISRLATALLGRFGIYMRLAVRGIADALSRTGVAVAALMLAVATTVGVGVMIESFRTTVDGWLQATLRADIYVSTPGGGGSRRTSGQLDPALVRDLLALPGIEAHSTGRSITLESREGFTDVFVLGLSNGLTPRYPLKSGAPEQVWPAFLDGEGVLISEPLAYHRGLERGASIELRTVHGPRRFAIAGIYYDYGSEHGEVLMPRALYERHFNDDAISGLGLYLAPAAGLREVMHSVRETVAAAGGRAVVRSNRELRELSMRIFDRTFTITEVLRLLAVAVAIVGIMSALMALQLERAREIAVLRATGFTPGQVRGMVTLQTGLMGLLAGLLALPTGMVLALLLIHVINRRSFGWSMQTLVPPEVLTHGLLVAVGAALAAGIYPAWRMGAAVPATALREE